MKKTATIEITRKRASPIGVAHIETKLLDVQSLSKMDLVLIANCAIKALGDRCGLEKAIETVEKSVRITRRKKS